MVIINFSQKKLGTNVPSILGLPIKYFNSWINYCGSHYPALKQLKLFEKHGTFIIKFDE
tara:strand:+ start:264 stop:440 length:177 start_codon:yes stop_codon:yes gene_type:complete